MSILQSCPMCSGTGKETEDVRVSKATREDPGEWKVRVVGDCSWCAGTGRQCCIYCGPGTPSTATVLEMTGLVSAVRWHMCSSCVQKAIEQHPGENVDPIACILEAIDQATLDIVGDSLKPRIVGTAKAEVRHELSEYVPEE